jgi:branched-chain amino acid transport system ATP-binding protein
MILLEARNLTKTFKSLVAVSDFSFDVKDKEILGLMGPNGAGKTTVINLVSGFLRPDSGIIDWHNENISGLKPFKIARKDCSNLSTGEGFSQNECFRQCGR